MASLNPYLIIGIIAAYFLMLIIISYRTSKNDENSSFFIANRNSKWFLVAIGMIGASLSGVTFISIPGKVGSPGLNENFSYLQMVFGYLLGYLVVAFVLLPIYYKYQLTSIYTYLKDRLGFYAYKAGSGYFILSRIVGASLRLYLVSIVFQIFVADAFGVPYWVTVALTIFLIWLYTHRGGIKTIVITDTIQTVAMILAVLVTIYYIVTSLNLGISEIWAEVSYVDFDKIFYFDKSWADQNNFFKQFFGGALITIVMTGMDQDMMQKNLTCRNLKEAQKNMITFSIILVIVNIIFLTLGALLYIFSFNNCIPIPEKTDHLYPILAFNYLPPAVGVAFIIGLIAAAYSSADSALTSLTTAFCYDFLDMESSDLTESSKLKTRRSVHIGFSIVLFFVIIIFSTLNTDAVINELFATAALTYGPILGLFMFAMFTKRKLDDRFVLAICIVAPILTFFLNKYSEDLFNGFKFGFLTYALNGFLTFVGCFIFSSKK